MTKAEVTSKRGVSPIWIVPIAALILGVWMVVHAYQTRGPEVTISFDRADGIEVGKTRVRMRAVDLGTVDGIELADDLSSVVVRARLDRHAASLLREDTQFWVVRPRLGPTGISGLSTLLSGPYIEISPGMGAEGKRSYRGLDDVPITPLTAPGLHLALVSPKAAALSVGNPVLYNGYTVGRVESATLDPATGSGRYGIFVEAPYDALVTSTTRFWNASGVSLDLNAGGLSLKTESLEALLAGGVTFGLPEDAEPGVAVEARSEFTLFPDRKSVNTHPYAHQQDYVRLFDTSVRGLMPGAPVQYRGMRIGSVVGVSFDYVSDDTMFGPQGHIRVPVLVRLDPARINLADTPAGRDELAAIIAQSVQAGMRATLKSGNLITGRLFVALDFFDDVGEASVTQKDGYLVLPTESSGLEQIEHQVSAVLSKLQRLPLESTIASATKTLDQIAIAVKGANNTLQGLDAVLDQDETRALPASVQTALAEVTHALDGLSPGSVLYDDLSRMLNDLSASLSGIDELTTTLNAQPSAVVFAKPRKADHEPGGTRP